MSKSAGKKPKEKSYKTKADNFVWTDDEVQLLLEVKNEISASMTQLNNSCVRHLGNALDKRDWH